MKSFFAIGLSLSTLSGPFHKFRDHRHLRVEEFHAAR